MKKLLTVLFSLCVLACVPLTLTACDLGGLTHTHTFGDWVEEVPATCTANGTKAHKDCTECNKHFDSTGVEIKDLTITALGHSYGEWVSNGNGTHTKTCSNDSAHTVTEDCHGGTATVTSKAVCSDCGAEYGEKLTPSEGLEYVSYGQ